MHICYAIPGPMSKTRLGTAEMRRRERILRDWAAPGADITVRDVATGPASIESAYEEYISVQATAELITDLERQRVDATILGCLGDPGLDALHEVTTGMPVIGPGTASCHVAAMLGERFGIVTIADGVVNPLRHLVARAGLGQRLAGVTVVDTPVLELGDDRAATLTQATEAARRLVRDQGADTVILGCMSMAFLDLGPDLADALGCAVVNPVKAALGMAQTFAHFGFRPSKIAYPTPRKIADGAGLGALML